MSQDQISQRTAWRPWCYVPEQQQSDMSWSPYAWKLVEIKRQEQPGIPELKPNVVDPGKLPPEFNVYGLYWRPWPVVRIKFDGP